MTLRTHPGSYAFDNDDLDAGDRHTHLSGILDPFTQARLSTVGNLAGLRCLELGAGGGSIARWLVDRVGPTGQVTATDVNLRHLPTDAGYQVLAHDLTTDPVPDGEWDLIHARLLLVHLSQRREILSRLVAALAPGGSLAIEEWDSSFGSPLLVAPNAEVRSLFDDYYQALRTILAAGGNDLSWPAQLHQVMLEESLVGVDTEFHARTWPGGSPGAGLHLVNIGQLRPELRAAGFTDAQLDTLLETLRDPRTVIRGLITVSTIGRRPANPQPTTG